MADVCQLAFLENVSTHLSWSSLVEHDPIAMSLDHDLNIGEGVRERGKITSRNSKWRLEIGIHRFC